jgi:hypothetical protein
MRISSNGNIGINISNPTEKLHVVGNIIVTGSISGSGTNITSLNATNITTGILPVALIANLAITGSKIATNTITATQIAPATITTSEIALLGVTNANIFSVDAGKITTGTLPVTRGGTGVTTSTGTGSIVLNTNPTFTGNVTFNNAYLNNAILPNITDGITGINWGLSDSYGILLKDTNAAGTSAIGLSIYNGGLKVGYGATELIQGHSNGNLLVKGNIGVGINPTEKIHVNGNVLTTGTVTTNNIIVNTFFQIYYRLTASSVITGGTQYSLLTDVSLTIQSSPQSLMGFNINNIVNKTSGIITFPCNGIFNINASARFNVNGSENASWFEPLNSYGANTNIRLGTTSTNFYNSTSSFTGYFAQGQTIKIWIYSGVGNSIIVANGGTYFSLTLLQMIS